MYCRASTTKDSHIQLAAHKYVGNEGTSKLNGAQVMDRWLYSVGL